MRQTTKSMRGNKIQQRAVRKKAVNNTVKPEGKKPICSLRNTDKVTLSPRDFERIPK